MWASPWTHWNEQKIYSHSLASSTLSSFQSKYPLNSTKKNAGSNSSFPFSPSFIVAHKEDMPKDGIIITIVLLEQINSTYAFFLPVLKTLVTSTVPRQPPLRFYFLTTSLQWKMSWTIISYFFYSTLARHRD